MNSLQLLDASLAIFAADNSFYGNHSTRGKHHIFNIISSHSANNNVLALSDQIFSKLIKDGYISQTREVQAWNSDGLSLPQYTQDMFEITFEGRLFYESGGYLGEQSRATARARTLDMISVSVGAFAPLAAFFSGGMYYFEYLKMQHGGHKDWPNVWWLIGGPVVLSLLLGIVWLRHMQRR